MQDGHIILTTKLAELKLTPVPSSEICGPNTPYTLVNKFNIFFCLRMEYFSNMSEEGEVCKTLLQVAEKFTIFFCYTFYYVYQLGFKLHTYLLTYLLTFLLTFYSTVGFNTTTTKHPIHIQTLIVTVTIVTFINHTQN